jgi:hypothetical protein
MKDEPSGIRRAVGANHAVIGFPSNDFVHILL